MIVTSAAGRRTDPVFSSVAQAARKLGTTVDGFLAGPTKHL
jgi:hypothetical protein